MAINYPLILPTTPALRTVEFHTGPLAGIAASPFTGQQQTYEWQREWWQAVCTLPPMERAAAEDWLAILVDLSSRAGTFLLGDPGGKACRGMAETYAWRASVDGGTQSGKTLATVGWNPSGWNPSYPNALKRGDYIQIAKNYITHPRAFDNALWAKIQCTITATNIVAINNLAEAERATPTTGATNAYVSYDAVSYPPRYKSLSWTFSVWLKAASGTPSIRICIEALAGGKATTLCALTTDWQQFSVTFAFPSIATGLQVYIGGYTPAWVEAMGPIDMWGASLYSPALDARLHKSLIHTTTDYYRQSIVDVWPRLREAPPDFSALVLTDAKGTFRLAAPFTWSLDQLLHYGISFSALEAF